MIRIFAGQLALVLALIIGASSGHTASLPEEKSSQVEPSQQFTVQPAREAPIVAAPTATSGSQEVPKVDQVTQPAVAASSSSVSYSNEPKETIGEPQVAVAPTKLKRDSRAKLTSLELDTLETGFLHPHLHPDPYTSSAATKDSGYDYDSGKNSYGKQASDWTLYDHNNDGLYDKYGDKAYNDQAHKSHSAYGKHDSYGNSYNSQNGGHGSGYYSRDRGYGYEKHYAYDKEVASKQHADNHNDYGSNHGLRDYYGNAASAGHHNQGHDRYGQLSRYGNHGYGKRGSDLAAHYDYGHDHNKGHYYAQHIPHSPPPVHHHHHSYGYPSSYQSSYQSAPQYKSSYSDYSPYVGYPSSYPSYY